MLTDTKIKSAKAREKQYKLFDAEGLFLLVKSNGRRYWRLKYRYGGREKLLGLGVYPRINLKKARKDRDDARELLAAGEDPSVVRKAKRAEQAVARGVTFEAVASEYFTRHARKLSPATVVRDQRILNKLIAPLGRRPIGEIQPPELLRALRTIEGQKTYETAHRALGLASRVFAYALAEGKVRRDPTSGLRYALAPVVSRNRAAITEPAKLGQLLRAVDQYEGQPATIAALKLLPMTFVRPGELRMAHWNEFDLDGGQWVIPAERTKMRREHIVPLAKQAVTVLRELHNLTGGGELVFPSLRVGRPLSENTINMALRNLGFDGQTHVAHGFRSTASTLLHELGFPPEVIELQLGHAQRSQVAAAYNRSARLPERREMMQAWADYLDKQRNSKATRS